MTETNSAIAASPQPPVSSATASASSAKDGSALGLASDFETFLKMLTAQARYQDPLKPIDSTEYASQLAQFSMVEQQVKTNETLSTLNAALGTQAAATLSTWVGMEVRAAVPVAFTGAPVTVVPAPATGAEQAMLVIRNAAGTEVRRDVIGLDGAALEWDGTDAAGSVLPAGVYSFDVENLTDGKVTATTPAEVYAVVSEAQIRDGAVHLVMPGGQSVPAADVTALRMPATGAP